MYLSKQQKVGALNFYKKQQRFLRRPKVKRNDVCGNVKHCTDFINK